MDQKTPEVFLEVIVERLDEKNAFLKTNGSIICWPKDKLPPQFQKEGAVFYIFILSSQEKEIEREKLAKQILNELLKGE